MSSAGGIIGSVKNCEIVNCYNNGVISNLANTNSFGWAGGIVGGLQPNGDEIDETNCKILNSYNDADISGRTTSGGIVCIVRGYTGIPINLQIENCYNTGNLISSNSANNEFGNGASSGIIGEIEGNNSNISISNVYNTGDISGYNYSNGIAFSLPTYNNNISIKNAYYLDNVENGVQNIEPNNTIKMASNDMKQSSFIEILNNNIENSENKNILSKWKLDGSYPIFE